MLDQWTYMRVRVVNDYVEEPYRRARVKKNGAVHLVHGEVLRALCGQRLGGRRGADRQPIEARGEPTCLRCRHIARLDRVRDERLRSRKRV